MNVYNLKIVQDFADLVNLLKFIRQIGREKRNKDSKFNEFGLQRNWLGNIIYVQIDGDDTDLMGADFNPNGVLDTKLKPIVTYLGTELGWSDYLVPVISNFVTDDDKLTLSYGVMFMFTGYSLTLTKLFWGALLSILGIAGCITAICLL
jgi:hypothetical protein